MSRAFALKPEIVRCADDAATEMLLPQPIHDHSREQVSRAMFGVGDPVGDRAATQRRARALGRRVFPGCRQVVGVLRIDAHQHLQESLRRDALFLIHIATFQEEGIFVEMRKAAAVAVIRNRLDAFAADHHRGQLGLRLGGEMLLERIVKRSPRLVRLLVNGHQRLAPRCGKFDASGKLEQLQLGVRLRDRLGIQSRSLCRRADRESQAADVVLVVDVEFEPDRQTRSLGKTDRLFEPERRGMIFAELRIDGPAGLWVVVQRAGDRETRFVLLESRLRIEQLDVDRLFRSVERLDRQR